MNILRKTCIAALVSCYGCANYISPPPINIDSDTSQITGWFTAGTEWGLFVTPERFLPESPRAPEGLKCVSVANDTGKDQSAFMEMHGQKVTMIGFAVRYQDLPIGDAVTDGLLEKRYFNGIYVPNFCLREYIFVATSVEGVKDGL